MDESKEQVGVVLEKEKPFEEMNNQEKVEAIKSALDTLADEKVRKSVENRDRVVAANRVLNSIMEVRAEAARQSRELLFNAGMGAAKSEQVATKTGEITESEGFREIEQAVKALYGERVSEEGPDMAQKRLENAKWGVVEAWDVIRNTEDPYEFTLDVDENNKRIRAVALREKLARQALTELGVDDPNKTRLMGIDRPSLNIGVNKASVKKQVEQISDTDYFKDLAKRGSEMRARYGTRT